MTPKDPVTVPPAPNAGQAKRRRSPSSQSPRNDEALQVKSLAFDASLTANSIANPDGKLTAVNDAFLKIWAYASTDEVLGKPLHQFFKDPKEAAAVVKSLKHSGQWEGDFVAKRSDDSTFIAHGLASVVRNEAGEIIAYQSSTLDITAQRQMANALQKSEAMYRDCFDLAVDGMLIGSSDGAIIGANDQMQILAGRSLEQLIGQHVSAILDPVELLEKPLRFDLLRQDKLLVRERSLLRPDGSRVQTEMHSKIMPDGTYQSIYRDITQRKLAEDALRESNELLARFMRDSPIFSYIKEVTPDTSRVLLASENCKEMEMVGIPGSQMVGMTMQDFFPDEMAAKITADDWHVVSTGETIKLIEKVNGRTYSSIKFPIVQAGRTLLAGYTIDITEQSQLTQAMRTWNQTLEHQVDERTAELAQSQARFRQLTEAAFEAIAISEDGILIDGNAQLSDMLGYELAEMIGRPVTDFIAPESHPLALKAMNDGLDLPYEVMNLRKDGTKFPVEVHARIRTANGKTTRVAALRDLTQTKKTAALLHAQQTALEHAQRLGLLTEISAGIIHQIGQPLSAMGVNLAVLLSRLSACSSQHCGCLEIAEETKADIANMRDVISHMRMLAHPDKPQCLPTHAQEVIEDLLPLLQQTATEAGALLAVDFSHPLPSVLVDRVQIKQVILNLVRNAFDACADCPPERRSVLITTQAEPDARVVWSIRDQGQGIAPEAMEHLFSPFFTTKAAGMGIGLRLSKTIVEAHGGRIEASNNPDGIGATFRIILPIHALPRAS